jgi:hypothetical protein
LAALSFLPLLDHGDATLALERRRASLEEQPEVLDRDRAAVEPAPDFVGAMFDYTRSRLNVADVWRTAFLDNSASTRMELKP